MSVRRLLTVRTVPTASSGLKESHEKYLKTRVGRILGISGELHARNPDLEELTNSAAYLGHT